MGLIKAIAIAHLKILGYLLVCFAAIAVLAVVSAVFPASAPPI